MNITQAMTQLQYSRLSTQESSTLALQDEDSKDEEELDQLEDGRILSISTESSAASSEERSLKVIITLQHHY